MHVRARAPLPRPGATVAVLLALLQACSGRPAGPANVLIVTLDTLRADHVGAYGYAAARTPVLDGLAARGARFANATTTTPLTLAAHTSLFTGTFPAYHGVRDNTGFHVDDNLTTMAEVFAGRGYRTGGFVGAFVLDGRWGIAQGFTDYRDDFNLSEDVGPGLDSIQRRGDEVVTHALAWLGQDDTQPFFGWVHLYDPHAPYEAPAEFASRFPAGQIGAYDAEIAYTDSQVGRLLEALDGQRPAGEHARRRASATTASSSASTASSRTGSSSTTRSSRSRSSWPARASRRGSCRIRCESWT